MYKNTLNKYLIFAVIFALFFLASFAVIAHSNGYRSEVANVAKTLRKVAGKDRNIGQEISQIAKEQEEGVDEVEEAKESVEKKGRFRVFFVGTDYKNIGVLRSKMVTTQNHLDRLFKTLNKAIDPETKAELEKQILELQNIKSEVETFIKDHESQFSILGWLVRFFTR